MDFSTISMEENERYWPRGTDCNLIREVTKKEIIIWVIDTFMSYKTTGSYEILSALL